MSAHIAYTTARELVGRLIDPPAAPTASRPPAPRQAPGEDQDGDALQTIPPATYIEALTGRVAGRDGKVCCPLPGHEDRTPSLQTYPEPADGWHCFGCGRGGTIIDFAAHLWGIAPRGRNYHELRRRLAGELLRSAPR